jgi:hypothetical protein
MRKTGCQKIEKIETRKASFCVDATTSVGRGWELVRVFPGLAYNSSSGIETR